MVAKFDLWWSFLTRSKSSVFYLMSSMSEGKQPLYRFNMSFPGHTVLYRLNMNFTKGFFITMNLGVRALAYIDELSIISAKNKKW